MDEQTQLRLQESYFAYFKKIADVVNAWNDDTVVQKLEELAHDDRYAAWASPFADSAKRYFCSDEWTTLFSKVENADPDFQVQSFMGYNAFLLQLLFDQCKQTKSLDNPLLITLNEGILTYTGKLMCTEEWKELIGTSGITMNMFAEAVEIRTSQSSEADLYHSLTLAEFRSIATAITYSLPVYKNLFNDIRVSLDQEGGKVYLGSTPPPWENQKE